MTERELAEAEARYQRAFAYCEAERANRNAAIQAAIDDDWTHERIAKAIGRTRARVGQITAQKPAAAPSGGEEPVLIHRTGRRHKPG